MSYLCCFLLLCIVVSCTGWLYEYHGMAGACYEAGTAYHSRASWLTPSFLLIHVADLFSFGCCVVSYFLFIVLVFVLCAKCFQCFWIVRLWLPLRYSLTLTIWRTIKKKNWRWLWIRWHYQSFRKYIYCWAIKCNQH
jgi:hypothetical protein